MSLKLLFDIIQFLRRLRTLMCFVCVDMHLVLAPYDSPRDV